MKNYYLILEIQANASNEAIKRAYRRLSKLYHPDINPRGGEQFKDINEANSILSDSEKRKVYDIKHKAAFSTGQNKNASNQPKKKANNTPNNTTYEDSERASTINCLLIKPDVIGAPKSENENKIRENARIV